MLRGDSNPYDHHEAHTFGVAGFGLFSLFLCLFVFCLIMFNSSDCFQAVSLFGTPEECWGNLSFERPLNLRRNHSAFLVN